MGNRLSLRHGWQPRAERVVEGLQGLLLEVDEAEIVAHEADDPNAFVDFFDSGALAGKDGRDVDAFAMHADSAACGDEDVPVVQGVGELGRAVRRRVHGDGKPHQGKNRAAAKPWLRPKPKTKGG